MSAPVWRDYGGRLGCQSLNHELPPRTWKERRGVLVDFVTLLGLAALPVLLALNLAGER